MNIEEVRSNLWNSVSEAMAALNFDLARSRLDVLKANIQDEKAAWKAVQVFETKLDKEYAKQMAEVKRGEKYKDMNPIVENAVKAGDINEVVYWRARELYYFWSRLMTKHKLIPQSGG